jgi:hypothetical protein
MRSRHDAFPYRVVCAVEPFGGPEAISGALPLRFRTLEGVVRGGSLDLSGKPAGFLRPGEDLGKPPSRAFPGVQYYQR